MRPVWRGRARETKSALEGVAGSGTCPEDTAWYFAGAGGHAPAQYGGHEHSAMWMGTCLRTPGPWPPHPSAACPLRRCWSDT